MAQLDETISIDQSGHISDHEKLHSKANYVFDVKDYGAVGDGTTDDTAAINLAVTAADAAGWGTVYLPPGTYLTSGISLAGGLSINMVGDGKASILKAKTGITGAVLDFTGWLEPEGGIGKAIFRDFDIEGDGVSDATATHYGLNTSGAHAVHITNVSITNTGGPAWFSSSCYFGVFDSIVVKRPIDADVNDVPYVYFRGDQNGSTFTGTGFRSQTSDPDGSSVWLIEDNDSYTTHDMAIKSSWIEYLHTPEGGAVWDFAVNASLIETPQSFDCSTATGSTTDTAYIRFRLPTNGGAHLGQNLLIGKVPGRATSTVGHTYGVELLASGHSVIGTAEYKGYNVHIGSGIGNSYINLTSGMSVSTWPHIVDDSGEITNVIFDHATGKQGIIEGTGDPEGVVSAATATLYLRSDGGVGASVYVKESGTGNTGWRAYSQIFDDSSLRRLDASNGPAVRHDVLVSALLDFDGVAGTGMSTVPENMLRADTAHVHQSSSAWVIVDGEFENPVRSTNQPLFGDYSLLCKVDIESSAKALVLAYNGGDRCQVTYGDTFTCGGWVYQDTGVTHSICIHVTEDNAGTATANYSSTYVSVLSGVWTHIEGTFSAEHADTTQYRFGFRVNAVANTVYVGDEFYSGKHYAYIGASTGHGFVPSTRIESDLEIEARIAAIDYTAAASQTILDSLIANVGYRLALTTGGELEARFGDGAADNTGVSSGAAFVNATAYTVKATQDISTGLWKFYKDAANFDDDALGAAIVPDASGDDVSVGANADNTDDNLKGTVEYVYVRDGIGGPIVLEMLATGAVVASDNAYADVHSRDWVLTGGVAPLSIVSSPVMIESDLADVVVVDIEIDGDLNHDGSTVGFYATTPITKPSGVSAETALVNLGLLASPASSESASVGEIYFSTAAATTISTAGTYYKAAGTTTLETSPAANDFTMPSNNRLTYGGTVTKKFQVIMNLSVKSASAAQLLGFTIAENGTADVSSKVGWYATTTSDEGAVTVQGLFELATNDYVELFVTNETGTNALTVEHGKVSVVAVG